MTTATRTKKSARALVCGSLAYDTIMVFPDRFSAHILPDKIHILNVAFLVPELRREFGWGKRLRMAAQAAEDRLWRRRRCRARARARQRRRRPSRSSAA